MEVFKTFLGGAILIVVATGLSHLFIISIDNDWITDWGEGSLLTVIPALIVLILYLLLFIPSMPWRYGLVGYEEEAILYLITGILLWALLSAASNVNFKPALSSISGQARVVGRSWARTIFRLLQSGYYDLMEILLRPKSVRASTNERVDDMPDPPDFIDVEATDGNQSQKFRATLIRFQQQAKDVLPEIPNLPVHSSDYEGWFGQTKKILAMRKQTMAATQHIELMRSYTNLYAEYHNLTEVLRKIQVNKNEMAREMERSNLVNEQMEVERLALKAKKTEHELSIARNKAEIEKLTKSSQPAASPLDEKKNELEVAKIQAQIDRIKNPPDKPKASDPIAHKLSIIRELKAEQKRQMEKAVDNDEKERIGRMFEDAIDGVMEGQR